MEKSLDEEDLPIPEHAYAGSELCVLEEDDMQCGHIFFNEATRLLKFFCTYCRETYDNINYFCEHLSQHINGDSEVDSELTELQDEVPDWFAPIGDEDMLQRSMSDEIEPDEAEQIAAEVQDEMRQALENGRAYLNENSCSEDFFGYDEEMERTPSPKVDFEKCFIEESPSSNVNVESPATDTREKNDNRKLFSISPTPIVPKKVKKKRVTTVKVIAVKNKVAELYEKYKLELEKRSQTNGSIIAKTVEDEPKLTQSVPDSDINIRNKCPVLQQKIVGETVITLLPDGVSGVTSNPTNSVPHLSTLSIMPLPQITPASEKNTADKERTCPACGKMFRSSFSLSIHKRSHYLESDSTIKLAHKCSHCDALFNKISELKEHIDKIHYPDGFVCKICNKRLSRLALLEMHMRKIHIKRPLHCNICKKNFSNGEAFEVHLSSHVEGQDYRCHICGRKYPTECVLKHHMQRHKERVQQCCVVCGKMTLRITQHMKIHTPRPKRVLSCSVCGKIFNFSSGLSHHFKIMHKFPRPPPKPKRENTIPIKRKRKAREHLKTKSEEIDKKEEEAKRVIVELIQNATYTPLAHNQYTHGVQTAPPIAREETISAINSIVSDNEKKKFKL